MYITVFIIIIVNLFIFSFFANNTINTHPIQQPHYRGTYLICHAAAPLMIRTAKLVPNDTPLMCLVSSFGGKSYTFNVAYGIGKAAIDRLATDASYQLLPFGVATVSLYPGESYIVLLHGCVFSINSN